MPFRHCSHDTEIAVGTSRFCRLWFIEEVGETRVVSTGTAIWHGTAFRDQALAACVADLLARDVPIKQVLRELNGQFALVAIGGEQTVAAVDRVRSIPLFYSCSPLPRVVTDDIDEIRCRDTAPALDDIQSGFFLKTGYTLGRATLLEGVSQLLPGELLICREGGVEVEQYYVHFGEEPTEFAGENPFDELDAVSDRVFKNTIAILDGRQAVVPLSGGYDSRYIAVGLKRNSYDNVLCFTYGRRGSPEVETAQLVAGALGFPWRVISYSASRWKEYVWGDQLTAFCRRSFQFASLPHLQEVLAINELSDSGAVDHDAVFLPGFCGDFLGGSYVPQSLEDVATWRELLREDVVDYTLDRHTILTNELNPAVQASIRQLAESTFVCRSPKTIAEFVAATERWFAEHKVAKFVINALRTYEHWGYDWYQPLWDSGLVDFWYRVPLRYRTGANRLYDRYLLNHYFSDVGVGYPKRRALGQVIKRRDIERLLGNGLSRMVRKAFHSAVKGSRNRDVNSFYAAGRELSQRARKLGSLRKGGDDLNSAFARLVLHCASSAKWNAFDELSFRE